MNSGVATSSRRVAAELAMYKRTLARSCTTSRMAHRSTVNILLLRRLAGLVADRLAQARGQHRGSVGDIFAQDQYGVDRLGLVQAGGRDGAIPQN